MKTPKTDKQAYIVSVGNCAATEVVSAQLCRELEDEVRKLKRRVHWYASRLEMLQREQKRFGEGKARTLLCDILANGQMLPDPSGTRYPSVSNNDARRSSDRKD